jgi:superfamily II DNA or RNA helicase
MSERAASSSEPEDRFVQLFAETFGLDRVQLLTPEFPFADILGQHRFIDFALRTPTHQIAFEIDGLQHFQTLAQIEDDQLRQNSLIHQGWRVFRWTERILKSQPDRVKDDLLLFLSQVPGLIGQGDFLPKQLGSVIELHHYQQEAHQALIDARARGETIALLTHATGTGKTVVAFHDARSLDMSTLYLVHRSRLVSQTAEKLSTLWPKASYGIYRGGEPDPNLKVVLSTVQQIARHIDKFDPEHFGYLIIDEAHRAQSESYKRILGHFQARFTLGLTATPERMDAKSILELFQNTAHRLSLEQAVKMGALVPIRCIRVKTNVDLSQVRFNHIQYHARDLEEKVMVQGRDELIVSTYLQHVKGKRTVVFAVNVSHAEQLAKCFLEAGIPAAAVSGGDSIAIRDRRLRDFEAGNLWVLCACDILNEGWDCPAVEVLFMARPTLSRIIYMQQLGRGTRRSPDTGKECLWVFDFVDNPSRYNAALSLHQVTKTSRYQPGALVLATDQEIRQEHDSFARSERPTALINLSLEVERMEEIDLFDWRDEVQDMLTTSELDFRIAATEGTVRRAIERGLVVPNHTVEVGSRVYHYFHKKRCEEVRTALGLPEVTEHTLKDLFLLFVGKMDMSASYKPVFLRAMTGELDTKGRAAVTKVAARFKEFYVDRAARGLLIDKPELRIANLDQLSDSEIASIMISMPFRKFQQKHFLEHDRDLAYLRFHPALWKQLTSDDLKRLDEICDDSIRRYYARLT